MATHGNWTDNVARLSAKGAIEFSKGDRLRIEDTYTVTMANGTRPLGYDVHYKYVEDGEEVQGTISKNVTGVPGRKARHPDYSCFRVTSIKWNQPDPRSQVWTATVTYEYQPSSASSTTLDDDIREISFGSIAINEPIRTTSDGGSVTNTAGDPLDPVPMAEIACPAIDIVRIEDTEPDDRMEWQGVINNASVKIAGITFPAHCARVTWTARQVESEEEEDDGVVHLGDRYEYHYRIEGNFSLKPPEEGDQEGAVNYAGWVQYVPNAGWNHINEAGKKVRNKVLCDDETTAVQDNPQQDWLEDDGSIRTAALPLYIKLSPYKIVSFSGLDLPRNA